jgi:hypothetical protein
MRRIVVISLLGIITNLTYSQTSKDCQNLLSYEREISYFNQLVFDGNFNLFVFEGNSDALMVETDSLTNVSLTASVEDSVLVISHLRKPKNNVVVNIFITTPALEKITAVGKSNIILYSTFENQLTISLPDESSDINVKTTSENFDCLISGSGFITISGYYNNFTTRVIEEASLTLNLLADTLNCIIEKYGFAILNGSVKMFNLKMKNESYLKAYNLLTEHCNVEIANAGIAHLNVAQSIGIKAKNDSQIKIKGNAEVNVIKSSKYASIKNKKESSNYTGYFKD